MRSGVNVPPVASASLVERATRIVTSKRRSRRPPLVLVLLALIVCVGMLVPIAYLLLRTIDAWDKLQPLVLRPRTGEILGNTIRLALAVAASTTLIA